MNTITPWPGGPGSAAWFSAAAPRKPRPVSGGAPWIWPLLVLTVGCASLDLPDPPVEDVAEKRQARTEEAVQEFEKQRDFAEFQAALARYQRDDVKGCEEGLQRLLQRNPDHRNARLLMAEVDLATNRAQAAFGQVEEALQAHPNDAQVQYTTGLLLETTGQSAGALAYYRRATELDPNNELYAISYRTALRASHQAGISSAPASGLQSHGPNGSAGIASAVSPRETIPGDESAGRAGYADATQTEPDDPQIPISAAVAALRRDRPDLAVELLQPAARGNCASAQVFRILGVAHYRLGDYRSSQVALQQALWLDKTSALTYFLMGCTLAKLGQFEPAQAHWRQARTIDARYSAWR